MPWSRGGTVAVTQNSTTVTGTGTGFVANGRVGDAFLGPDGRWYEVTNIASDTALSILPAYLGATVNGGVYALAPMQGYVKQSADALRALVNQFGAKLAALGTTGNYDILPVSKGGTGGSDQETARAGLGLGSVAIESTVPVTKGGTGVTTVSDFLSALNAAGNYSRANILGTVGQASGVPTGAIIETGANANGTYTKYADGTLICTRVIEFFVSSQYTYPSFSGTTNNWTYPAAFITNPATHQGMRSADYTFACSALDTPGSDTRTVAGFGSINLSGTSFSNIAVRVNNLAIGKWY